MVAGEANFDEFEVIIWLSIGKLELFFVHVTFTFYWKVTKDINTKDRLFFHDVYS